MALKASLFWVNRPQHRTPAIGCCGRDFHEPAHPPKVVLLLSMLNTVADDICQGGCGSGQGADEHGCLFHRPADGARRTLGIAGGLPRAPSKQGPKDPGCLRTGQQWLVSRVGADKQKGGDGLVAARHLRHYGYQPSIYYPKRSKNELYQRLSKQLEDLNIPFVDDFPAAIESADHVVDAIFGFSFSGEVREPFPAVIRALEETKLPVTSVDAPSSWDIENGPPKAGVGSNFHPAVLVSLTAPKPLVNHFKGRHFIGGRFVAPSIAAKYDFEVPAYEGIDQVVEVASAGGKLQSERGKNVAKW